MNHSGRYSVSHRWQKCLKQPAFQVQLVIALSIVAAFGFIFPSYFDYLEARNGTLLNDPLLGLIPPKDSSWIIFFFLYTGIVTGIICNIIRPKNLLIGFEIYCMVTILRLISLYLVPLDPPAGYIPLKEPFVGLFTNGGRIISKDLFFSGHVSTILSLYFSVEQKQFKSMILVFSIMVGTLLLVQHVHYTIDVLVSPFATYACSIVVKKVFMKNIS